MKRYEKNMDMLSRDENLKLKDYKVCVVGCGGLGGYIIEMLGRLGIGYITAIDGDVFDETNLNRQLLSDMESIGMNKAESAKRRMSLVNPEIHVQSIRKMLTRENSKEILKNHNIIVDALDSIEARFILQDAAEELNIPIVHGAIAGWYGQITTILPGDRTLENIYPKEVREGIEKELGNPSFTPALVASIQVSEVLKLLIGRGEILRNKLLSINTLDQSYDCIDLK